LGLEIDRCFFSVDSAFQFLIDRCKEIVTMVTDLKTKQVVGEKAFQYFFLLGTNSKCLGIGPRNVPEKGSDEVGAICLTQVFSYKREMKIVDPHKRFLLPHFLEDGVGERAVHLLVRGPVGSRETGSRISNVRKRPKTFVGVPVIITIHLVLRKEDPPQFVGWILVWQFYFLVRINGLAIEWTY